MPVNKRDASTQPQHFTAGVLIFKQVSNGLSFGTHTVVRFVSNTDVSQ